MQEMGIPDGDYDLEEAIDIDHIFTPLENTQARAKVCPLEALVSRLTLLLPEYLSVFQPR